MQLIPFPFSLDRKDSNREKTKFPFNRVRLRAYRTLARLPVCPWRFKDTIFVDPPSFYMYRFLTLTRSGVGEALALDGAFAVQERASLGPVFPSRGGFTAFRERRYTRVGDEQRKIKGRAT